MNTLNAAALELLYHHAPWTGIHKQHHRETLEQAFFLTNASVTAERKAVLLRCFIPT